MLHWRSKITRLRLGFETLTGLRQSGFFIPYAHAGCTKSWEHKDFPDLRKLFDDRRPEFQRLLRYADACEVDLSKISNLDPPQPRFEQDWFPRLDAVAHYVMVRRYRPRRIIEVGSGHSSRWLCRAITDEQLEVEFHAIDPSPRADISQLPVTLHRSTLQDVNFSIFDKIEAGDFVCVDSSHIFMPGSDVEVIINRVLPRLPAGVFVFFHDIFLPDAYPEDWRPLGYNEQNAVAVLMQGSYEPVFASAYATRYMKQDVDATVVGRIVLHPGGIENGLWLRKTR